MRDSIAMSNLTLREAVVAMRSAKAELNARMELIQQLQKELEIKDALIKDHRRYRTDHERMVARLLDLLNADDLDHARDILRTEFVGIHGP